MKYIEISMKQIQDLVYEQGAIGDRIDWNIESAKSNVTKGNKELDDVEFVVLLKLGPEKCKELGV